jgi:hypothetical protein
MSATTPASTSNVYVDTGAAALPVVAWLSNISPYLTAAASVLSIIWFSILIYDRFKKKN